MGYTHYFDQQRDFTDDEWEHIGRLFKMILDEARKTHTIELQLEYNDPAPIQVDDTSIRFNGVEDDGHETFYIQKEHMKEYNFCKTARKPYDLAVCLMLIIANEHANGALKIGTDGDWDDEWMEARGIYYAFMGRIPRHIEDPSYREPIDLDMAPIVTKKAKTDYYHAVVSVYHGDADKDEEFTIECKDRADLVRVLNAVTNVPTNGNAGGDESEYRKWCDETFGEDMMPYDCIYDSSGNLAAYDGIKAFYTDPNGQKFAVQLAS